MSALPHSPTALLLLSQADRIADLSSIGRHVLALRASEYHADQRGQQTPNRAVDRKRQNAKACSVWVVSNQMEAAMLKCATITGSLTVLAIALLASGRAEAGASASAPSKYSNASHVATVYHTQVNRQARNRNFAITEYSSSSAKNPPRGHGYR
jgi:hypothetical protein